MGEIAAMACDGCAIVEFGSGSSTKTPPLLRATRPRAYVPIDISGDYLTDSAAAVDAMFPAISVYPVEADFTRPIALPPEVEDLPKLGFFPGSTIGNFIPHSACDLLRHFRRTLGAHSRLLIGMDRVKPVARLIAAYDDPEGVTAAFNLNLLDRINRELGADIPVDAFAHEARWHEFNSRIEMHLVAKRDVLFTIAGHRFAFARGSEDERAFWRAAISGDRTSDDDLARAIALLRASDALSDTVERARHYGRRALDALAPFPASRAKAALTEAVEFAISRAY